MVFQNPRAKIGKPLFENEKLHLSVRVVEAEIGMGLHTTPVRFVGCVKDEIFSCMK
jgi:hypothetical protein